MTGKDDVRKDIEQQTESAHREEEVQLHGADVSNEPVSPRRQGRSLRLVLLVLLLVVLAAVAWFVYFTPQPSMRSSGTTDDSVAKRESRPIPSREREVSQKLQDASHEASASKVSSLPSDQNEPPISRQGDTKEPEPQRQAIPRPAAETQSQVAKSVTEPPAGGAGAEKTESAASVGSKLASQQGAGEESSASAEGDIREIARKKISAVEKTSAGMRDSASVSAGESEKGVPATQGAASSGSPDKIAAAQGAYTVQVGAYTVAAHLAADQKKLHDLGFESSVLETQRPMRMIRLRVGTFFPSQGEAQMARLTELGAEPFFVKDGDLMVVYAGSFRSDERAERLSERLAEAGVHVEAEPVSADVHLSILRFGPFETFSEARSAAREAGEAGLETLIVKTR